MTAAQAQRRYIEAIPDTLLQEPLNFIFADHYRQRVVCTLLEELADADRLDVAKTEEIVDYLTTDMLDHVVDEEEDLFPLLRRRCAPEDEIELVLAKLSAEHSADQRTGRDVVDGLRTLIAARAPPRTQPDIRATLLAFVRSQRRHLIAENNIVLPIARARLIGTDLANLAKRMAGRRGISLSDETGD